MKRSRTIIGLGTLGGFLCKHISEIDTVKELVIVDFDIIERKNTYNSIYSIQNIGEYKVDALADIILDDVSVTKIREKYIEGKTRLLKSDLVIDCRDYVCDRHDEIDVRFYISERTLLIDCRKRVETLNNYPGRYTRVLTRSEINKAAFYAAQIITSEQLTDMLKNNSIHRINLDLIPSLISDAIKRSVKNKIDIIYEASDGLQQLHGLEENIKPILEKNKTSDINVCLSPEKNNIPGWPKVIEKQSLKSTNDVLLMLSKMIKETGSSSNFVTVTNGNRIELIEETGGA